MRPDVQSFFHPPTWTITHVVRDPESASCAIVDPVLDFDAKSGRTSTAAADEVIAWVRDNGLETQWLLETHAHADHLSAAPHFKAELGGKIAVGAGIVEVQAIFKRVFNAGADFDTDGGQFDHLFQDGEEFAIGGMTVEAWHTPGHTPACTTYVTDGAAFVGDTLFMPDSGTARCDFPGGEAATLYRSIRRILALAPATLLYMCHDYGPGGRDFAWITSVADERKDNPHVRDGIAEDEFVRLRTERDATLQVPNLLLPSVQVNMRAGRLPPPEDNGISYLKLPLNAL
jgi:glyoxylase-like metal-dependent hydrolase (beta-lactamase superfamily II)